MLFASLTAKKRTVLELISWKHSFRRLNEEYEMVYKKKQALDNLLDTGRISEPTHQLFNKEIDEAIAEIERQHGALLEKMSFKMKELEEQIKTLETLYANFEIQHVTGEVEEEVYQREVSLLSMGLETARHELDAVRDAVNQLSTSVQIPATDVGVQQEMEPQASEKVGISKTEVEVAKESVSTGEKGEIEPLQTAEDKPQETLQSAEGSQSTETKAESGEKKEA
jgi:hypothetical protein